jgi:hypothetical protein
LTSDSYNGPSTITIGVLIAIAILVPALAASVLVFGLQGPLPTATSSAEAAPPKAITNSTITMAAGPCAGAQKYEGLDSPLPVTNVTLSFPIFAIPAATATEVCVVYVNTDPTVNVTVDLAKGASVGTFGTQLFPNGTVVHPFVAAAGVSVVANQSKLVLGGDEPAAAYVAYTIQGNGTRGFYFLNIAGVAPDACSDEFRLAIGYSFTSSNATGSYFPIPEGYGSCGPSGGPESAAVYAVKGVVVVPLMCGTLTCDNDQTA